MNRDIPDPISVESRHRVDASGGVMDQTKTRLVNYTRFRAGHLVHPPDLAVDATAVTYTSTLLNFDTMSAMDTDELNVVLPSTTTSGLSLSL